MKECVFVCNYQHFGNRLWPAASMHVQYLEKISVEVVSCIMKIIYSYENY